MSAIRHISSTERRAAPARSPELRPVVRIEGDVARAAPAQVAQMRDQSPAGRGMQDGQRDAREIDDACRRQEIEALVRPEQPARRRVAAPVVKAAFACLVGRHGIDADVAFPVHVDLRNVDALVLRRVQEGPGQRIAAHPRAIADAGRRAELPGAIDRRVERIAREPDAEAGRRFLPDLGHDFADGEQVQRHGSGAAGDMPGLIRFPGLRRRRMATNRGQANRPMAIAMMIAEIGRSKKMPTSRAP